VKKSLEDIYFKMSVQIKYSDLTKIQKDIIKKHLIIKSKPKYKESKVIEIRFFIIEGDTIFLPYWFSKCLFRKDFFTNTFGSLDIKEFKGELREEQVSIFEEAFSQITKFRTTSLFVSTGTGKTFISTYMSHKLKCITLVLIHLGTLAKQWLKSYLDVMPELEGRILVICKDVEKEYTKCESPLIVICMINSTHKLPQNIIDSIEFLVIDEAHCFTTEKRLLRLLKVTTNNLRYIQINTATPNSKEDGTYDSIKMLVGSHFIEYKTKKIFNTFIINTELHFLSDGGYVNLMNDVFENSKRNDIVLKLVKDNLDRKIIIVGYRKEHCKFLYEELVKRGFDTSLYYDKNKTYKDAKILIVSYSKVSTGFDEKNKAEDFMNHSDMMIDLSSHAKKGPMQQIIGRIMRTDKIPYVVFLNDRNSTINSHMTKMRRWCRELNGEIHEIKISKFSKLNLNEIMELQKNKSLH